eukprot:COSAG04_NODE_20670_length_388_cov_2.141869_1_plen_46_part_10
MKNCVLLNSAFWGQTSIFEVALAESPQACAATDADQCAGWTSDGTA